MKINKHRNQNAYSMKHFLSACAFSLLTGLVCKAVVASDIEIYKQARSGDITLMMLFDISGSMGAPQSIGDPEFCDLEVDDRLDSSNNSGSEVSSTTPSYTRYYCNVIQKRTYKYRKNTSSLVTKKWETCTNNAIDRDKCTWGTKTSTTPTNLTGLLTETVTTFNSSYTYYFEGYTRKYYDRITRLKDAMFDLLLGNSEKGISPVTDDKILGLAAYSFNGIGNNGYILLPARRLGESVTIGTTTKKHRAWLLDAVANKLYARGGTPTANAYAEVAAYLLGTKTFDDSYLYTGSTGKLVYFTYERGGLKYYTQCTKWDANGNCTYWPSTERINVNTAARSFNFFPLDLSQYTTSSCGVYFDGATMGVSQNGTCYKYNGSVVIDSRLSNGFNYSISSSKNLGGTQYKQPDSLTQTPESKQCSGQGIYVLTDGVAGNQVFEENAMRNVLNDHTFSCEEGGKGTDCVLQLSNRLLKNNAGNLEIKTAVVGFGSTFNSIASYDRSKTQQENLAALELNKITTDENLLAAKRTAEWGIKGEGGWYSGSNSEDIVESINNFINDLGKDIPSVTTGAPEIPVDPLNTSVVQNHAYYAQFQPTPDKSYQVWLGNVKKYTVNVNGKIVDKLSNFIADNQGRLIDNYDLWSPNLSNSPTDEEKAVALMGGVKSQLSLQHLNNPNTTKRKLLTNRDYTKTDYISDELRQITLNDIEDAARRNDPALPALINLLGYAYDPKNYSNSLSDFTIDKVKLKPELRQIGSVMHSTPILFTNSGQINYTNNKVETSERKDYVLFGTTQGLLHVVDAVTGMEKFAFVPNEIIETQKEAFSSPDLTSLGLENMYYGIDAPWTIYTEYVVDKTATDSKSKLTVGEGKNEQYGKQIAYGGLRMGGRSYYALDLVDVDNPKIKFQIEPQGTCDNENPLGCMGQSWSKPTITWVNWKGKKKMVMLVGGGYDAGGQDGNAVTNGVKGTFTGYEVKGYSQTNQRGAGVYMFDALTGQLLWWSSANATASTNDYLATPSNDMKYSVVSQIKIVDRNSDGLSDHLYFGDLGGQVWRIDLNNEVGIAEDKFAKTPVKILDLSAIGVNRPRFYEAPAFSTYTTGNTIFGVVSIGSGNRSHPLIDYTVGTAGTMFDGVFNIYDKDVARSELYELINESANSQVYKYVPSNPVNGQLKLNTVGVTLQAANDAVITTASKSKLLAIDDNKRFSTTRTAPYGETQGWYYLFTSGNKPQSEKVMASPMVINNDMYVTSFDGSRDGLSGDCGAGVKGESFITLFCMPYGQCPSGSAESYRLNLGAGIVGGTLGAGDVEGMIRRIIATVDTTGISNNEILKREYQTENRLVPQRWYIKQ